jgi:hypothetical protein
MTRLIERCRTEEGLLGEVQACLNSKGFQLLLDEAREEARPRQVLCQVGTDAIGLSALQHKEDFGKNAILTFMEQFSDRFAREVNRKNADEEEDHFGASDVQGRQDPFSGQRRTRKK